MARELTLVRHAKSSWVKPSWNDASSSDFDRPLKARGLKNAPEMGKRLRDANYQVDVIISSPALRAITTAEFIASELDYKNIQQCDEIYEAGANTLLYLISSLDEKYRKVMLVGHNPGFTMLCNYLCDANIDNMPTCSIARIQLTINSWQDVGEHCGELLHFDYPKKNRNNNIKIMIRSNACNKQTKIY